MPGSRLRPYPGHHPGAQQDDRQQGKKLQHGKVPNVQAEIDELFKPSRSSA